MSGLFGEGCKYWLAACLKMEKKVCLLTVFSIAGVTAQAGDYLRKTRETSKSKQINPLLSNGPK